MFSTENHSTTENYASQAENNTGFFDFLRGITTTGNKIAYMCIYTYTTEQAYVKARKIVSTLFNKKVFSIMWL